MIQAVNNFVFVIRDESETETSGFILPDQAQEKQHRGTIYSVGDLVEDKKIKEGKKCLFHKGNGFDVEHEGQVYLVIEGVKVIAVI